MDIKIQGRNLKITDGLEEYTNRKLDRLDRYLPNIREIRVELARQHNSRGEDSTSAQITVQHARGALLRAEEKTSNDIHYAIDSAVDKMYRQIERFKGKREDNKRRKGQRFMATLEELDLAEPLPVDGVMDDITIRTADGENEIIRRKDVALIPMDELEAIEQMELLGHNFFMFYNAETGEVNVVYRRANSGYGLLQPIS